MVLESFDLKKKNRIYLKNCIKNADECFFVFSARSNYDEIRFKPLILYPDVFPAYQYYDAINTATILDLVRGFEQNNSPFNPEDPITKIQAIKVVLGAADLMKWKEKFQITPEEQKEATDFLAGPLLQEMKTGYREELEDFSLDDITPEILSNAFSSDMFSFDDSWWQWRYLAFALKSGIIDVNQAFNSDQPMTEEELSQMINKTLAFSENL